LKLPHWLARYWIPCLALAFALPAQAHENAQGDGGSGRPGSGIPEGVSASDWAAIRAAHEADLHAVAEVEGGHSACNPGQNWTTFFDGRGFSTRPEAGQWHWGLDLVRWGFEGHEREVGGASAASVEGGRISYPRDGSLSEWYVNDRRGLEHGYTVSARPEGSQRDGGSLEFTLSVRGDLCPQVDADGRGVRFVDGTGACVLTYSGLVVLDADGRSLLARLDLASEGLRLRVDERGARYPLHIDPLAQQAYLKASNAEALDAFGNAVAVSGTTVVVGAKGEASNATGVDGNQSNNGAASAGAVYVFVRSGTTWSQQAYLKASNTGAGDTFGYSVAVSGDTIVVGARNEDSNATGVNGNESDNSMANAGAAYVFVRSGAVWSQQAYLKASNTEASEQFGTSVAVSGDTIVVGAHLEDSNAVGVNGNQADNSAPNAGAAYVFVRSGTTWSQQAYLKASNTDGGDNFGFSTTVSGDSIVISATGEASNATGVNGNQADNSATSAGAAYVFLRSGTTWSQQAYLKASNTEASDVFGSSVSIDGDTIAVGATGEDSVATGVGGNQSDNSAFTAGAAYVFVRSGTVWSQQAYLKASNTEAADNFGSGASVSGDLVVVGASQEDSNAMGVNGDSSNNGSSYSGAAYLFRRVGTVWSQAAYVKASNTGAGDFFGLSAAIDGDSVVIGSISEDSNATGVDGDQSNNSASAAGAAYVFALLDTDGDGVLDAFDNCLNVSNPTQTDTDADSLGDACDNCPGVSNGNQTDTDGDATGDACDGCPNDPAKIAPGQCGCGVADTDTDGDNVADCVDGCPNDPAKTDPGLCGCGVADTDTDGDATPDCNDGCPLDPAKTVPGQCGCGVADIDTDGDAVADCNDGCPNDPAKTDPGLCGCGVADTDTDGDATPDCNDGCPSDPLKTAPGQCGCGVADTDTDGDTVADCVDGCPNDPLKISPGQCGCGVADTDTDGDAVADCVDGCPNDPLKTAPGQCGCGVVDIDTDGDAIADCVDNCPADSNPLQENADGDGLGDACDNCPNHVNSGQEDCDDDGTGDVCAIAGGEPDCNSNAIPDGCDISDGTSQDANQNSVPDECEGVLLPFCYPGVNGVRSCPCGNPPAGAGTGCNNFGPNPPGGTGGAQLDATGSADANAGTSLVFHVTNMQTPCTIVVLFSGSNFLPAGVANGAGVRCVGDLQVPRPYKSAPGFNASSIDFPSASSNPNVDPWTRSNMPAPGTTKYYYAAYRNPQAGNNPPCTPSGAFNLTNAGAVTWMP